MIKKLTLILSLSLLIFSSSFAEGLEAVKGKITDGYNFWLYTPPTDILDNPDEPIPLIIFLHGKSLSGHNLDKVKGYGTISALEKGRQIPAYIIAPQLPSGSWKPAKIMEVVDYMCQNYDIDENRISVLGMCLGGYGALDFAGTYPDRIAAVLGVSGGSTLKDLSPLAELPLWLIHGTADNSVPVAKSDRVADAVKGFQEGDTERLAYDRLPGVNHSRTVRVFYRPETYEWLLSHSLDTADRPISDTPEVSTEFLDTAYSGLSFSKSKKSFMPYFPFLLKMVLEGLSAMNAQNSSAVFSASSYSDF